MAIPETIYLPQEDSYFLSEILRKEIKNKNIRILEIGCGSGIQLQTLNNAGVKKENVLGVDINEKAVEYCRKLGFNSVKSNLFEKVKSQFDLIIFNPPYLPENEYDKQPDTSAGKFGSEVINKFLRQAKSHLSKNGKILLLTSSHTKKINWTGWKKKKVGEKNLFFEKLYVWKIWR